MKLNKEKIIDILRKEHPFLRRKYHLGRVGLFGSYAKDTSTEESDIDLIVDFEKPIGLDFIEFGDYLEKLFNKKVDLITNEGFKNSVLKNGIGEIVYVN